MQLKLPRNKVLSLEEVAATVSRYRKECPAVIDLFDRTIGGPHDEIIPIDVLALNALNAFGGNTPPMDPMTSLWVERHVITKAVQPLTTNDIVSLTDVEVDLEISKVDRALETIRGIQGFGWTSSAKLFHRLRPNIGAIWDSRVEKWYPEFTKPYAPQDVNSSSFYGIVTRLPALAVKSVLKPADRQLFGSLDVLRVCGAVFVFHNTAAPTQGGLLSGGCPMVSAVPAPQWHEVFLRMMPAIVTHAKIAFRNLAPEAKQEAVQDVVCNACRAVARLTELGKLDLAYPSVLASYAVAQVKDGRKVGCRLNVRDVASPHCQMKKGVKVSSIDHFDDDENGWKQAVVVDTRSSPVPEIVAFRCDFADWLQSLPPRDSHIAESLAVGNRTSEVARQFEVSEGRISQLRREFAESWHAFVGDEPATAAA